MGGIKDQIKKINSSKLGEYGKDYMKIKFNSDDDLPLNKQWKFLNLTIIVRTVFEEDGKYYPQIFLDEYLYENVTKGIKMLQDKRIDVSEGKCR